jgi:hypothetical protein
MNNKLEELIDYFSNLTVREYVYWASALAVLVVIVWGTASYVGIRNAGIDQELGMVLQWNTMEARYSQGRLAIVDQLKIADDKKEALAKLLKSGVGQRSVFTDDAGRLDRSKFISVVHEAYPELTELKVFDRLFLQVQLMRKQFASDQGKLFDQVRAYDSWRVTGGLLQPFIIEMLGFPSDILQIRIGQKVLTGKDAYEKLSRAIISQDAVEIFETGTDRALAR